MILKKFLKVMIDFKRLFYDLSKNFSLLLKIRKFLVSLKIVFSDFFKLECCLAIQIYFKLIFYVLGKMNEIILDKSKRKTFIIDKKGEVS